MLTYKSSGVDIEKAEALTEKLKKTVKSSNIGMFAGLMDIPVLKDYQMAATTDGIGSKIIPLIDNNMPECIAIDLIAMNLNDLICIGAIPMFFLDYIAVNKLDVEFTSKVLEHLKNHLAKYNTMLLGGETSELSDLITKNYFDIAGFAVGLVRKDDILTKDNVKEDDVIIALESNGIHSNGFTLIRKLYENKELTTSEFLDTLKPTHIYVKEILELCEKKLIKICANITGGGIKNNLERIIPSNLCAHINLNNIPSQEIFEKIQKLIGKEESYKTFNMGVGFCIITNKENSQQVKDICRRFNPFDLGVIKTNDENCNICFR